ncbi:MAG: hypothetical protein CL912_30410 [Deltaproteobacteria bacterium]|nr:hypothetical protein [Deltaproteobacteria bacterium]
MSDEVGKIMVVVNKLQLLPISEILRLDLSQRQAYKKGLRLDKAELTVTNRVKHHTQALEYASPLRKEPMYAPSEIPPESQETS